MQGGVEVELLEDSGPVSPRFAYSLSIRLVGNSQGLELTYRHSQKTDGVVKLEAQRFDDLWGSLAGLADLPTLVTEELRQRVGISINQISCRIGAGPPWAFEYTLADLDEHPDHQAAVEALKAWAEELSEESG